MDCRDEQMADIDRHGSYKRWDDSFSTVCVAYTLAIADTLAMLSEYCSEFLIHAADVEGLCKGIDEALVQKLGEWVRIPTTYAGGAKREYESASAVMILTSAQMWMI